MPRKISFEPAQFDCDRRLSRAARQLVQERILPLLPDQDLTQAIINPSTCIFHPDRDVLLQDELHSNRIPAVGRPAGTSPRSKRVSHWYECGYSNKTFLSKYYLDLHLERAHPTIHEQGETAVICPARDYCHVFGDCEHKALELEPYYGRGSGGIGSDAHLVRQMNCRKIQPCNQALLQQEVQPACRQAMRDCFSPQVANDLVESVCDTLTCHNRLHQLAGHVIRHVHTWKSQWNEHHDHSIGWVGLFLIVLLLVYYLVIYKRQRPLQQSNRLLSKRASPSKWTWLRGVPTKKKIH